MATAITMTIGTKTPETWSASRCTSALPVWASSTSLAICASWVSEPTRVARTTSRPPALTVAPVTASPSPTSTGTDSPVSMEASTAEVPETTTPSVAIFSPGRTTNSSPTARSSTGIADLDAVAQHRDVLGAELEQRAQCGTGLPLGPLLEVAAGEDEHRDAGSDLEVDVRGAVGGRDGELERVRHARGAGGAEEQRVQRPQQRRERAERDQRVHGRGAVRAGWSTRRGGTARPPTRPRARPASSDAHCQ